MNPKKKKQKPIIKGEISVETHRFINIELSNFMGSIETERSFPNWLSNVERAWVHDAARKLGLTSRSDGKNEDRFVTVYKTALTFLRKVKKPVDIKPIADLTSKLEALSTLDFEENTQSTPVKSTQSNSDSKACLERGLATRKPMVAPASRRAENLWMNHPIHEYKYDILQSVYQHAVTIITGETGCGKTTQVPQYILEDAAEKNEKVKIICSLPRRVATISVAERVANERMQSVGATVGYQIRHESRVSSSTCLTFCTTGVVLRTLLLGDALLKTCTHIIIDEIHERDSLSDFTLIALRERLPAYPHLKIILMSATLDIEKLVNYFEENPFFKGKVGLMTVPGALHHVQITHLETILTKFEADEKAKKKKALEDDFIPEEDLPYDAEYFEFVDKIMESALADGHQVVFDQLQQLVFGGHIPVNYQTRERKMTPLMVAAKHGQLDLIQLLFGLGATDKGIRDKFNNNASFYAEEGKHQETIEFFKERRLASGRAQFVKPITEEDILNARGDNLNDDEPRMSEHEKVLVDIYMQTQNRGRHIESQFIDYEFIIKILENLQQFYSEEGAILIFLPGYEEIMTVKRMIENYEEKLAGDKTIVVYTLHSRMKTGDQKAVFQPTSADKRKVILATNIAETSITINDVSIVIDTGKVKERTYDILSGALILGTTWISKACARQRAGRAGRTRPGICLRLYTSEQHQLFQEFHIPEMLRIPLQELCLQTKLLAPSKTSIADFLSQALDPPQTLAVERSVKGLKMMDALDCDEKLTDLGRRLVNLPVLPHLGKMLVTAILLKCLEPVLTIVSCLSAGDIFKLPSQPALMMKATEARMELVDNSMSDHFLLLRIFEEFVHSEKQRRGFAFCDRLCLSYINMQQVVKIRNQILSSLQELIVTVSSDPGNVNENSKCWPLIKAALTAGLYPNIARANRKCNSICTAKEPKVNLHSSCCFKNLMAQDGRGLPPWILFEELHRGLHSMFGSIRTCTMVTPVTVFLFAGPRELSKDCKETDWCEEYEESNDDVTVNIDNFINFSLTQTTADYLLKVRALWGAIFKKKLNNPKEQQTQDDLEKVLSSIKELLVHDENNLLKNQPSYFTGTYANTRSRYGYISQENQNWRNNGFREGDFRPRHQQQHQAGSWRAQNENLHQQQSHTGWGRGRPMPQNQHNPKRHFGGPGPMSVPGDEMYSYNNQRLYQGTPGPNSWRGSKSQPQASFHQGYYSAGPERRQFSDFEMNNWREERHSLRSWEQPGPNFRHGGPSSSQGNKRNRPFKKDYGGPRNDRLQLDCNMIEQLQTKEETSLRARESKSYSAKWK